MTRKSYPTLIRYPEQEDLLQKQFIVIPRTAFFGVEVLPLKIWSDFSELWRWDGVEFGNVEDIKVNMTT